MLCASAAELLGELGFGAVKLCLFIDFICLFYQDFSGRGAP